MAAPYRHRPRLEAPRVVRPAGRGPDRRRRVLPRNGGTSSMTEKPLPKSLQAWAKANPDKFAEGWKENDGWSDSGWSNWVYLKPGWRNILLDPMVPMHAVHEGSAKEALRQLRGAVPCN